VSDKYIGFTDRDDVAREFEEGTGSRFSGGFVPASNFPTDAEIVIAVYDAGGYEGAAFVLFRRDGKFYEVNASHCSCYGLEGQWGPEETTITALLDRSCVIGYSSGAPEEQAIQRRLAVLAAAEKNALASLGDAAREAGVDPEVIARVVGA
jgi:hypothetical protein